jgi:hypothetical protein
MSQHPIPKKYSRFVNFMTDVFVDLYHWQPPSLIQREMADYLQDEYLTGNGRDILQAYRGCGKSSILQCFVVWLLMIQPQLNILITSETYNLAKKFVEQARRIIAQFPYCGFLIPDPDQIDSASMFYVRPNRITKDPSVEGRSITSQITGFRADHIFPDDNETPRNTLTHAARARVEAVFEEYEAVLKKGGGICALGTPHSEDTVYNKLKEKGYRIRQWRATYPTLEKAEQFEETYAPSIIEAVRANPDLAGRATDPERLDDEDLRGRLIGMGKAGFERQYNLDTTLTDDERTPLKLRNLIVMDCDREVAPIRVVWTNNPENKVDYLKSVGMRNDYYYSPLHITKEQMLPYDMKLMYIDPSGQGKDETGVVIVYTLAGRLYLMKSTGFRDGYSIDTLNGIVNLAKEFQVNKIITEKNYGGGMFTQLLQAELNKKFPVMVEDASVSNRTYKEKRILNVLEPLISSHKLVVDTSVITQDLQAEDTGKQSTSHPLRYCLFYQLTRLSEERGCLAHDDRLDALAGACGYLMEQVNRDDEKTLKELAYQAVVEEENAFFKAMGIDPDEGQTYNWIGE